MNPADPQRTITSLVTLIITVFLVGATAYASKAIGEGQTGSASSSQTADVKLDKPSGQYKNGKYNATGTYSTPNGNEMIALNVVLNGDIVAVTSASANSNSFTTKTYQKSFIKNYKQKIIGKKVDTVKLDHVGTSSLTSDGFNSALEMIKNQAKS